MLLLLLSVNYHRQIFHALHGHHTDISGFGAGLEGINLASAAVVDTTPGHVSDVEVNMNLTLSCENLTPILEIHSGRQK
jgi:hypothetical protein